MWVYWGDLINSLNEGIFDKGTNGSQDAGSTKGEISWNTAGK